MAASTALSPTAHDQDLLVDVVIGLDQPEHHFGRAPVCLKVVAAAIKKNKR
jgi:hypothetical protein